MFVVHIALQGCLRAHDVEFGVNADTGGHIRYLLDLVEASRRNPAIDRIEIVTRAFDAPHDPKCYSQPFEPIDPDSRIVRLRSASSDYLPKEALWTEHPSLCEELVRHIASLDRRPDVLHAHYADAGAVAADVSERLGIPFVFTAHSLGRIKASAFGRECAETADLDRRIAIEERVIAGASAIIASSRDEAEVQYAAYTAYDPGRIRIIPPGSDVAAFVDAPTNDRVSASIDRFLDDPAKPVILAIARPVTKKNLAGLIHAYGRSPDLQALANLVLIAGTRDDLRTLEPEIAGNLSELLTLIDNYDLYGRVAYPKTHGVADVPAIYAHARARRGVFVNPALNEPFGLTLLEAAASGLPIVATDSGGPNDIVETCENGVLVNPRDGDAIARAIESILTDRKRYDAFAASGARAVAAFDWDAHVTRYVDLLRDLTRPTAGTVAPRRLLVCDIDGTLLGCRDSLARFGEWHATSPETAFAVATGRSFHSALAILSQEGAPLPDVIISSVGSEIYHRRADGGYDRDRRWDDVVSAGWDGDKVTAIVASDEGIMPQGPLEQRRFKRSYLTSGDRETVHRLRASLDAEGQPSTIIESHGRYLDILPYAASKGTAVEHVRQTLSLPPEAVIAAGDSGNDVEMLRSVPNGIIVANHSDGIGSHPDLARCYLARHSHAAGVMEGIAHFSVAAG